MCKMLAFEAKSQAMHVPTLYTSFFGKLRHTTGLWTLGCTGVL